jgi:5,10-methylenetetrahydromethanopterin reductase
MVEVERVDSGRGVAFPAPQDPHMTPLDLVDLAKLCEASGYADVFTPEGTGYESMSLLGAVALATERVRIGTAITGQPLRSPALTAMGSVTLDLLSQGRFVLGLGFGHRPIVEGWHGIPFETGRAQLREYVEVVREIASGDSVSHDGEHYHAAGRGLLMSPYRKTLPIYLSALAMPNMELAGEIADGMFGSHTPLPYLQEGLERARRGAETSGRDPDDFDACCFVPTQVTDKPAEAREVARARLAWHGNLEHYNKVYARSGFEKEANGLRRAWEKYAESSAASAAHNAAQESGQTDGNAHLSSWGEAGAEITQHVSDDMLDAMFVIGDAEYCRARLDRYSENGIRPLVCSQGEYADRSSAIQGHSETLRSVAPAAVVPS